MQDSYFYQNDALHAESSTNGGTRTGLRLVLPPLSAVKALKGKKKGGKGVNFQEAYVPKAPRPLKLKPLKEVLVKLIAQIKKKDDYAFFLAPVDTTLVPNYLDVIKNPMDLGTVEKKVNKGRYRSLEEFANDVRLVTSNAKLFNPPGTIYHTEAERIENYAIDHINRAAATVIEFESDWNIDVEQDEDESQKGDAEENGRDTPMDVDGSVRARSPSVASMQASRRGPKGKKQPGQISESLEPDGHLPGYKDGVGVFPPGSEWADLMLSLKLKGKRYKTKKERLRIEKSGPPTTAEGSIDYTQMEDPFSILNVLVPEPRAKPQLTPLYQTSDPHFPSPVSLPPDRPLPQISLADTTKPSASKQRHKRRHWTITRTLPSRRARDTHGDENEEVPAWKTPHEPHTTDYGAFAILPGQIAQEYRVQTVGKDLGSEPQLFGAIRHSVEHGLSWRHPSWANDELDLSEEGYWARRGRGAEEYVRDVVYGGIDGLAYVRSLAEFVTPSEGPRVKPEDPALGVPLAQYVEETVVDPLTEGRHRLLRETAKRLHDLRAPIDPSTAYHVDFALNVLPRAAKQLVELRNIHTHPLDMAALIRKPEELFLADNEWAGKAYAEEQHRKREEARRAAEQEQERVLAAQGANAMDVLAFAIQSHERAQASPPPTESAEMLKYALDYSADVLTRFATQGVPHSQTEADGDVKMEDAGGGDEDPTMRKLRMNLLSLAKRAPLDKLSRLPADLVPEAIRHIVPTID